MSFATSISDLTNELQLRGQSPERCAELEVALVDAVKVHFGFSSGKVQPTIIMLYPCEVLAAQLFLTQFGFHLDFISSRNVMSIIDMNSKDPYSFRVSPNWE